MAGLLKKQSLSHYRKRVESRETVSFLTIFVLYYLLVQFITSYACLLY